MLILIGALFLLQRFDPELGIGHLLHRYWPVLLIVWGAAKLIDHFAAGRSGEDRPPLLTGSEAVLLALLVMVLAGIAVLEWLPRVQPQWAAKADLFQNKADQMQSVPSMQLPPGSRLRAAIDYGSITVRGTSGNELRLSADVQASGSSETAAKSRLGGVQLAVDHSNGEYFIHVTGQNASDSSVRANLSLEVPSQTPVSVLTQNGDVQVSGATAGVTAQTGGGDLDIHDCEGDIAATAAAGDTHISNIKGNVTLNGRGDDVDINDVSGNATLAGSFMGTVVVRSVDGNTQYAETRTNLVLSKLSGRIEADADDLKITDVAGPVRVSTRDKDVEIDDVTGPLDVANTHGDIAVRFDHLPSQAVNIANGTGDVTLSLPSASNFQISAVAGSGEVDSDFEAAGLQLVNSESSGKLSGSVGSGGPHISITTSYGTIQLRKSSS